MRKKVGGRWRHAKKKGAPLAPCPQPTISQNPGGGGGGGGLGGIAYKDRAGLPPRGQGRVLVRSLADGAGSYSVAHKAGLLPTELTGMWYWILLRSPHQGRGSPPAPAPTKQRPGSAGRRLARTPFRGGGGGLAGGGGWVQPLAQRCCRLGTKTSSIQSHKITVQTEVFIGQCARWTQGEGVRGRSCRPLHVTACVAVVFGLALPYPMGH